MKSAFNFINLYGPRLADFADDALYAGIEIIKTIFNLSV